MEYIGEHLLPGQIGHFCIILGFVASILSAIAYFFATQKRDTEEYQSWRNIGRIAFLIHGFSFLIVIGLIFYIMVNQFYEYQYVQQHVSHDLDFRYIFSAFWEGQEGSFLLWMFWHIILGFILMANAKEWEAPVLSTIAFVEIFISSMLLGIYINIGAEPLKIGINPLMLLRDVMDAPIFAKADYVSLIKGNGLNPLLQNYWMTIHPPTLFLGFASTIVPFAYAVAGLWTKQHKAWLKPALSWALFSGAILGTGILMGGAWAYEALSFGGYWAWDPVENTSLVPWIIMIAGIHTNLVAKSTGFSIKSTYAFYLLAFIMIIYSTTLTRSGILGDTSVHAFTEMGLESQLFIFILGVSLLALGFFFSRFTNIPSPQKEEETASKEFWMFIGSLVLLFSSILITFTTSIPVYQKVAELLGTTLNITSPIEPVEHYNKYQLWIGVFVGLLSGVAQYLRYKEFNWSKHAGKFTKHIAIASVISAVLTIIAAQWINVFAWQYKLLLFSAMFGIITNLDYLFTFIKGNLKLAGSVFAHVGFGIMVVGILASGLNKEHISTNRFAQDGLVNGMDTKKNILLIEDSPMFMSGYEVTYVGDTLNKFVRSYEINYKRKDKAGNIVEEFSLFPNVQYDKGFSKVAATNPSTKHYLHKDIFTHIASLPPQEMDMQVAKDLEDSLKYIRYDLAIGDTIELEDMYVVAESLTRQPVHEEYHPEQNDLPIGANLTFILKDESLMKGEERKVYKACPSMVLRGNLVYTYPILIDQLGAKTRLVDDIFERVYTPENKLDYKEYVIKEGGMVEAFGQEITFEGFNKNPEHANYKAEEGDIAVGAMMSTINKKTNEIMTAQPVYLIRGNAPYNFKDEIGDIGLHFRFVEISPQTQSIKLMIAKSAPTELKIPVEIATNAYRSDYVILEAILFPGINFVWLGTIMMMFGLAFSMMKRMREKVV